MKSLVETLNENLIEEAYEGNLDINKVESLFPSNKIQTTLESLGFSNLKPSNDLFKWSPSPMIMSNKYAPKKFKSLKAKAYAVGSGAYNSDISNLPNFIKAFKKSGVDLEKLINDIKAYHYFNLTFGHPAYKDSYSYSPTAEFIVNNLHIFVTDLRFLENPAKYEYVDPEEARQSGDVLEYVKDHAKSMNVFFEVYMDVDELMTDIFNLDPTNAGKTRDCVGRELKPGDIVAYWWEGSRLKLGKVKELTKDKITIYINHGSGSTDTIDGFKVCFISHDENEILK